MQDLHTLITTRVSHVLSRGPPNKSKDSVFGELLLPLRSQVIRDFLHQLRARGKWELSTTSL